MVQIQITESIISPPWDTLGHGGKEKGKLLGWWLAGREEHLHGLEDGRHLLTDSATGCQAGGIIEAVVNAAVDAAHPGLLCGSIEASELADQDGIAGISALGRPLLRVLGYGKGERSSVERFQNLGSGPAEGAVAGGIARERWGFEERSPIGLGGSGWIAIGIGLSDGIDWTPEVVDIFGVPGSDTRIGESEVEQSKRPRVFDESVGLSRLCFGEGNI